MGLLLGCSILSVVEILDHFLLCCLSASGQKKKTNPTYKEQTQNPSHVTNVQNGPHPPPEGSFTSRL